MIPKIEIIEDQIFYTIGDIELRLEENDGKVQPIHFDLEGEEEYWDEHWEEIEENVIQFLINKAL